jgi:hypothetical protein
MKNNPHKVTLFELFNLVLFYALVIWLGTSAFYLGSSAIQGAADGYSVQQRH